MNSHQIERAERRQIEKTMAQELLTLGDHAALLQQYAKECTADSNIIGKTNKSAAKEVRLSHIKRQVHCFGRYVAAVRADPRLDDNDWTQFVVAMFDQFQNNEKFIGLILDEANKIGSEWCNTVLRAYPIGTTETVVPD